MFSKINISLTSKANLGTTTTTSGISRYLRRIVTTTDDNMKLLIT